jgi:hypothetical protein
MYSSGEAVPILTTTPELETIGAVVTRADPLPVVIVVVVELVVAVGESEVTVIVESALAAAL